MDKAPEVLASIVAMKTGGVAAGGGALGGAQSETQSSFFEYVSENLNDEQVNYLGAICHKMNNESFKNELHHLISKYANV